MDIRMAFGDNMVMDISTDPGGSGAMDLEFLILSSP